MAKKPVLGPKVSGAKQPDPGAIPPPKLVTFSFKFFREIDYFGTAQQPAGWFHSLLAKLADLSRETLFQLNTNPGKRRAWRFHPINWNQTNIPIRRADLTWLGSDIIDNADEFPLLQFQISTALGRVVGFLDQGVFNVVLLDPLHNIQPSKKFDYRVRETIISESVAAQLMKFVDDRLQACDVDGCACRTEFADFQNYAIRNSDGNSLIVGLSAKNYERVVGCITQGQVKSIEELIDLALTGLGV